MPLHERFGFEGPLVVEHLPGGRRVRLDRRLVYITATGCRLIVPAGFVTDLASIPQIAQAAIGKLDRHARAAVLHDWLYARRATTRREADRLFLEAMRADAVGAVKRCLMWMSVRAFGWLYWRNLSVTTFERLAPEYADLWRQCEVRSDRLAAALDTAGKILANRARYEAVEARARVPWYVVGMLHAMEAGLRFDRHLHNGDPLTARTRLVPAGRPVTGQPPYTFDASAVDALAMKGLHQLAASDWTVERIAYECERYNGWGYRKYHPETLSPYLWAATNHYRCGKYVADGKWSATAVSAQIGAMALLKALMSLDDSIAPALAEQDPADAFRPTPERADDAPSSMAQSSTGNTAVLIGGSNTTVLAAEISAAVQKAAAGGGFSFRELALALATSPTFYVALLGVAGAAYIWLERRRKLERHGI